MHNGRKQLSMLLFAALFCAALPAAAQTNAGVGLGRLSSEERELLQHGRLVMRRHAGILGAAGMYGGTSWQRVKARPSVVWQALLDTPEYPRMLPQVAEARLVEDDAAKRLVYLRHGSTIVGAQYHLIVRPSPATYDAQFHVDPSRPRSLRQGRGRIAVLPYGEDQSLITFNVIADLGGGMIASLLRPQIQDGILRVPQTMKQYIERGGRDRYL